LLLIPPNATFDGACVAHFDNVTPGHDVSCDTTYESVVAAVPEPSNLVLLAGALVVAAFYGGQRRNQETSALRRVGEHAEWFGP
jgi:hypothetical protein